MKRLYLILLLIFLIIFSSCDYWHDFEFSNTSTRDVVIFFGVTDMNWAFPLYPDTALIRFEYGISFKKGETQRYVYSRLKKDPWNDTVCFFILDADTLNTYSWEEIQNNYKILQRYDISPKEIKALKYEISYPPDERMKNIKMYPPYEKEK
jgi:hypothetical protein